MEQRPEDIKKPTDAYLNSNQSTNATTARKEILTIAIEIDQGVEENLHMYEGDDPAVLAQNFCTQHNIDAKYAPILEEQIKENLDKAVNELVENNYPVEENLNEIHNQVIAEEPQKSIITESENQLANENEDEKIEDETHPNKAIEEANPEEEQIGEETIDKSMTKESPIKTPHKSYMGSDVKVINKDEDNIANEAHNSTINSLKSKDKMDRTTMLYQLALKSKEEQEKYAEIEKKKKKEKEMEGVTWHPNIFKSIRTVMPQRDGVVEDMLIKYGNVAQEKKELIKSRALRDETSECTFKPRINSEYIDKQIKETCTE